MPLQLITCQRCDGAGKLTCCNCCGTGSRYPELPNGAICSQCRGRGKVACEECEGAGEIETEGESE